MSERAMDVKMMCETCGATIERRWPAPLAHIRQMAIEALCEALNDQYPHLHAFPHDASKPTPPGVRTIRAAIVLCDDCRSA